MKVVMPLAMARSTLRWRPPGLRMLPVLVALMPAVVPALPLQAAPELVVLLRHGHKDRPAEAAA